MSAYTTGEVAKLCGISVRTVQFYDTKDLLHPASLTEGGRRLYSEDDLSRMRLICALKSLGLSLDSIRGILKSERPERVLLLLLDEQERRIEGDLQKIESQKQAIKSVREAVRSGRTLSLESIAGLDHMVEEKRSLIGAMQKCCCWQYP
jgi:DNA-binding transcriptional MerR regulator